MTTNQIELESLIKTPPKFSVLIDDSYKKVYEMAYRLSGSRQDAEDLTQEACLRAYKGFQSFEGDRPFLNWMYRIVTRLFLDMRRNRRRRVNEYSLDAPVPTLFGDEVFFEPSDSRRNPEQEFLHEVLGGELQDAINSLSPSQRALVQMVDLDEMDHKAAAVAISRVEGTVRTRLHRAHRQMQDRLARKHTSKALMAGPATSAITRRTRSTATSIPPKVGSIAELAAQMSLATVARGGAEC